MELLGKKIWLRRIELSIIKSATNLIFCEVKYNQPITDIRYTGKDIVLTTVLLTGAVECFLATES